MTDDYSGRLEKSANLLHVWINEPGAILVGLGNSASTWSGLNGSYPHMVPVEILGEEGLIGAAFFKWRAVGFGNLDYPVTMRWVIRSAPRWGR